MNKRSVAYAFVLLIGLIAVSVVLNRGPVLGVLRNVDIDLTTDSSSYVAGQTVVFTGTLGFPLDEEAFIHQAALVVDGPGGQQHVDTPLPLAEGVFDLTSLPGVTSTSFTVAVSYNSLGYSGTLPDGTLGGGTMPGGTIPPYTCPLAEYPLLSGDTSTAGTLAGGLLVPDGFWRTEPFPEPL